MLRIEIQDSEMFDETKNEFVYIKGQTLLLEHSLVSLSKWEMKWKKPFLTKDRKSKEEIIDYIRCMDLNEDNDPNTYLSLTERDIKKISDYINDKMTASVFYKDERKNNNSIITSEVIYYYMISLNIPFECQYWHLNRLTALIDTCNIKNNPNNKYSRAETLQQNKLLNQARRAKLNSKG